MAAVSKDRLRIARLLLRIAAILMRAASKETVMVIGTKRAVMELEYREIVQAENAVGTRIDCLRGRVWITEHGSPADIVLEAGESHEISRPGRAVVQALRDAVVALRAPAVAETGAGVATALGRSGRRWAAPVARGLT
jgi:hypothetical protein